MELSTDGYLSVNLKGMITDCNSAFLNHTGYSREDIVNKHFTKLPTLRVKDIPQFIKMSYAAIRGKVQRHIEYKWIHKDGSNHWGEAYVGFLKKRGIISGYHITTKDITEHKKVEEKLHREQNELWVILDSVPAMVFYKDKKDRFLKINAALAQAFNMSKEEIVGKTAAELSSTKDYWEDDKKVMRTGKSLRNIIEPMKTQKGMRWVQTDKIPYRDTKGNILGIIGFAVDITEQKRAEEKIKASLKEKEVLLKEVHHRVKNNLADPGKIALKINVGNISIGIDTAIPCGLIINELVSNSLKHAFPQGREGRIRIAIRSIDRNEIELKVSDNGVGLPDGIDIRKAETLGLHLVTILGEDQLDGKIRLSRTGGTEFKIRFKIKK